LTECDARSTASNLRAQEWSVSRPQSAISSLVTVGQFEPPPYSLHHIVAQRESDFEAIFEKRVPTPVRQDCEWTGISANRLIWNGLRFGEAKLADFAFVAEA